MNILYHSEPDFASERGKNHQVMIFFDGGGKRLTFGWDCGINENENE